MVARPVKFIVVLDYSTGNSVKSCGGALWKYLILGSMLVVKPHVSNIWLSSWPPVHWLQLVHSVLTSSSTVSTFSLVTLKRGNKKKCGQMLFSKILQILYHSWWYIFDDWWTGFSQRWPVPVLPITLMAFFTPSKGPGLKGVWLWCERVNTSSVIQVCVSGISCSAMLWSRKAGYDQGT